jgi:hypothetical protein
MPLVPPSTHTYTHLHTYPPVQVLVMRDYVATGTNGHALSITVSTDDGHHWSTPAQMRGKGDGPVPHHVEPKLFLLENGVLVRISSLLYAEVDSFRLRVHVITTTCWLEANLRHLL